VNNKSLIKPSEISCFILRIRKKNVKLKDNKKVYVCVCCFFQLLFRLIVHKPKKYLIQIANISKPICTDAVNGSSFDPGISCQLTSTSTIGMLSFSAMNRSSTSNALEVQNIENLGIEL